MKAMSGLKLTLVVLAGVVLAVGLLIMVGLSPVLADTEYMVNTIIPIDFTNYVPCANGGAGEDIHFSGEVHDVLRFTIDNTGGFHGKWHENLQGVSGIGLTTGDTYQGTGAFNDVINGKVGEEETVVYNSHILGPGPNNNLLVHALYHITVHPDGTVTAYQDNYNTQCQ